MSTFPAITGSQLIKALRRLGFDVIRIKGSDHLSYSCAGATYGAAQLPHACMQMIRESRCGRLEWAHRADTKRRIRTSNGLT